MIAIKIAFVLVAATFIAPSSAGSSCLDKNTRCATWSSNGHCTKWTEWMNKNCAKACGKCGGTGDVYSCRTTGGSKSKCVFPFTYQARTNTRYTYNGCTQANHDRRWCATKVDRTGKMVDWGNCDSDC